MKRLDLDVYQGSTQTVIVTVDGMEIRNVRAKVKRTKADAPLFEFLHEISGNVLALTLDGRTTEKINLIGDYENLYYDVFVDDVCVLYGTLKMTKGVSCGE